MIQKKFWNMYNYIKENLYLCRNDVNINNVNVNAALYFGLATAINCGKQLTFGEYGLGKTTSSENIISLVYNYPREVVLAGQLKGNPEQTEEKMIGRPNLGELNQGIEKVIWSTFVHLPPKIIDEINRLNPGKQNVLLEGADRKLWKYMNEVFENKSQALYATSNYQDSGNNAIIPPLLDRFDVAVESKHPGPNKLRFRRSVLDNSEDRSTYVNDVLEKFSEGITPEKIPDNISAQGVLSNSKISANMIKIFTDVADASKRSTDINELRNRFASQVKVLTGLEPITDQELDQARLEINNLKLSKDAMMFYDIITTELASCQIFGQKRTNEDCKEGCHYVDYLCSKIKNCMSVRTDSAIKKYAATTAWLLGSPIITPEHLGFVLPYNIWHKTVFKDDHINEYKDLERGLNGDPLPLYVAKKATDDLKRRFAENKTQQEAIIKVLTTGDIETAKKIASQSDHPVFNQYLTS